MPTPRRRRTADETRRLLLDAGTRLALDTMDASEAADGGPLAHIRVQDVCLEASRVSAAPVTTGAAYHLWPNQKAFQVDLMFHILESGAFTSGDHVLKLAAELFASEVPPEQVLERLIDESFEIEMSSALSRSTMAFMSMVGVPAVRDALRTAHRSFLDSGAALYEQLLTYGGLRIREPYTLDQLMTAMSATTLGLLVSHSITPEQFKVPPGARSLVATATSAVFDAFCEAYPPRSAAAN